MIQKSLVVRIAVLLAAAATAAAWNPARACTAVDIVAADGTVIAGRTMEWSSEMEWTLVALPRGTALKLTAPSSTGLPPVEVRTRHAVLGVGVGVIPGNPLLEGQNSAGLAMSGNFLPGFTQYQAVGPKDASYVSILGFGAWALGSHSSVAELKAALSRTKVWGDSSILPAGSAPPTLHFVFVDRTGAGMVVEYVKGELRIHDNVAHVLTNAPTYDWHILNLRNYLNLSTVGKMEERIGEVDVTALGQGGGMVGIPGDYTPPSRFVHTAFLRHHVPRPADGDRAIQVIGHILNDVDIPAGIAQSKLPDGTLASDFTQFVVIKDLTRNRMLVADAAHRLTYVTLDLDRIFAQTAPATVRIADLPYPKAIDGTQALLR
jgi:penicillin V acylase-like amidase (Ntn superfamily)